jgi:diguanylate cyclase (GGDEF)-like protein
LAPTSLEARETRVASRRARQLVVAGGLVLAFALVTGVAWFIDVGRENAFNESKRDLMSVSRALSEDTRQLLQGAETLQDGVIDQLRALGVGSGRDWATNAGGPEFREALKRRASDHFYVEAIAVIDASGNIVSASDAWPAASDNLADRDYFRALQNDANRSISIGDTTKGRVLASSVIHLARRISGPGGKFLGAVIVAIKQAYFESAYAPAVMPDVKVSLFRADGVLLARAPHIDADFARRYGADPIFDGEAPEKEGVVIMPARKDGPPERLVGFDRLSGLDLVLCVSKSTSEIMAKWNEFTRALMIGVAALLALIATTIVLLTRSIDQQGRTALAERARVEAEARMASQREVVIHAGRLENALNNMLHGLCMFDADERLIVCNFRYAKMYGLPEDLTRPGTHWRDIVAHHLETFRYRDSDMATARFEAVDLRGEASTCTRELADGRTILIRNQPITEGGWVATHDDITERRRADERLSHMARHDVLTGLPNRLFLQERMDDAVDRLREGEHFAVLCLDVDHFKQVNDTLGHPIGDALLREFAGRVKAGVGPAAVVARIGGDEFAVLRSEIAGPETMVEMAERLARTLNEPYDIAGNVINIGASFGIALAPRDGEDGAALLRVADIALYRAKAEGRGRYRFFEPGMDWELQKRRQLELEFRQALKDENFEVFYQPLLDARAREIRSFEALVRWRHPQRGLIPPNDFIPLAEETGLIVELGEWVLRTACREASRWPRNVCVSVNLSAHQFKAPDLVGVVRRALADAGLPGERLELEITETVLLGESDRTLGILHEFRDMGVKIAMDDFGTGYSSLSYLRSFPFDKIKIDKSFVLGLDQHDARAIVRAIAGLGKSLSMTTTAEGVETEAQLGVIIEKGCTEAQGYLFSKPVPASELAALLTKYNKWSRAA